jgi:predicted transcriptional regulator
MMMNESKWRKTNLSFDTLKGMQSVRATFTLPKHTINLLSAVANQLGVKQKSIFDHLVEDKSTLDQIADQARNYKPNGHQRKQKTFVLSRNCLRALDTFAREYKLPRDVLVEFSIKQLHPVIAREKKRHENRKKLLNEMKRFQKLADQFMDNARYLVGEDDNTVQKLEDIFSLYDKSMDELKTTIEKGKCMEEFQ